MAVLNIRNLDEQVHAALRLRAAKARRSMEAEARAILTQVCGASSIDELAAEGLQQLVDRLYGAERPQRVVSRLLKERRREAQDK